MKKNKKIIYILLIILVIIIISVIIKNKKSNIIVNNTENKTANIMIENAVPDEEKPEEITTFNMTEENKLKSVLILNEFNNGKNLSTEQSKEEINNIIYTIFGVTLQDDKSINGLEQDEDGNYVFKKNPELSLNENLKIEELEDDVAAGTVYSNFKLYSINDKNEKKYIGDFVAEIGQNTESSDRYIKSISRLD